MVAFFLYLVLTPEMPFAPRTRGRCSKRKKESRCSVDKQEVGMRDKNRGIGMFIGTFGGVEGALIEACSGLARRDEVQ